LCSWILFYGGLLSWVSVFGFWPGGFGPRRLMSATLIWRPPPRGTPANIPINLIFPETRIIGLSFCRWQYWSIFIEICAVGSKRRIFSVTECALAVQGHSRSFKVDDFGTNRIRKRVCDFLLVINSHYGPILHRFWDTATYWLKIAYFPTPLSFGALAPYVPFEISRWS